MRFKNIDSGGTFDSAKNAVETLVDFDLLNPTDMTLGFPRLFVSPLWDNPRMLWLRTSHWRIDLAAAQVHAY
jgi:hypothetical protein